MLPFVHFLVVSSHFILAFSQSALVVGVLSAAITGAAKATVSPSETIAAMTLFMTLFPPLTLPGNGSSQGYFHRLTSIAEAQWRRDKMTALRASESLRFVPWV